MNGNGNGKPQHIRPIITVGLDDNNQAIIAGPLHKKEMCLNILVDALKFVLSVDASKESKEEKSNIIMPQS